MQRTQLIFQRNAHLTRLLTTVTSIHPFSSLPEADRTLFKQTQANQETHVLFTDTTIFHPQGGGQPSDEGMMEAESGAFFDVQMVRMSNATQGVVLHFGSFADPNSLFSPGQTVTQKIDVQKRLLYSRYHTAGHVLGAAVRNLFSTQIPDFDELKASHFPNSAACEFQGTIDGKWKDGIQREVDEYIIRDMAVEIEFWDEAEFRARGLERLIPDRESMGMERDEKFRVVKIGGVDVYPCGGTHVDSTGFCGKTNVKKISRSKGTSRVGYYLP